MPDIGVINILFSTQMSMIFILLINVKMPTIVGILTFISRINTTFNSLKASDSIIFQNISYLSSGNFMVSLDDQVNKQYM